MHWGGWSLRYQVEDFMSHTLAGKGADWPFGYDELEPWYTAAEVMLAVGGEAGEPGPPRTGPYPLPAFPWSAHEALLADAFEAQGLVPDVDRMLAVGKLWKGDWLYFPDLSSNSPSESPVLVSPAIEGKRIVLRVDTSATMVTEADVNALDLSKAVAIPAPPKRK